MPLPGSNWVPSARRWAWSDHPTAAAVVNDAPHDDVATAREPALPHACKATIVGIGASAGGLEAITLLIGRLDSVKQDGRSNDIHLGRLDGDECRWLDGQVDPSCGWLSLVD